MNTFKRSLFFLGSLSLVAVSQAKESPNSEGGYTKGVMVEPTPTPNRWRFGASAGVVLGIEAEFTRLGAWNSSFTPAFGSSGDNRTYDDGFNNVDSSDNAENLTWNWGYQNDSQYDPGSGTLALSTFDSLRSASVDDSDEPQFGLNVFGLYDMGVVNGIHWGKQPTRWGIKTGIGYQRISIGNRSALTSDVLQSTDTFALGGGIPPLAPYSGSFAGPGPLISDIGVFGQQTIASGALVTGSRDVDANLFLLSLGPYLEFPLNDQFSLYAEAGANIGFAHGSYEFASITTIRGIGTQATTDKSSDTKFIAGVYVGLGAGYALSEHWSLYADVKYQYLSPFEIQAGGSQAELNFDSSFAINLGALYRF